MPAQTLEVRGFRRVPVDSLPLFWLINGDCAVFYAPRQVCVLDACEAPAALRYVERLATEPPPRERLEPTAGDMTWRVAARLVQAARGPAREVTEAGRRQFRPECLTVYVNHQCNLRCRYCFSQPRALADTTVSPEAVRAAARLVAEACAARSSPFTVAFHGGGEPTLSRRQIDRFLRIAGEEGSRFGLRLQTYIATNGVVSEETANWLATQFDLVGVSCDGPPDIQDRQRPGHNGQACSDQVGRTMSTLRHRGRPFHARATITHETVDRQEEIVTYLADHYVPEEVRLEPVYVNRSGATPLATSQAAAFVSGFLAAQAAGAARGISVTTSITRADAVYGPYCNVLRKVLNLVPGDLATGCFLDSRLDEIGRRGAHMGSLDAVRGVFHLEASRIRSLIARCSKRPAGCDDCMCSHQCTYGCPDVCMLVASPSSRGPGGAQGSFRCLVNRMLMERIVLGAADRAWARTPVGRWQDVWDERSDLSVIVCRNANGKQEEAT
jgi:uncharacterized protein